MMLKKKRIISEKNKVFSFFVRNVLVIIIQIDIEIDVKG